MHCPEEMINKWRKEERARKVKMLHVWTRSMFSVPTSAQNEPDTPSFQDAFTICENKNGPKIFALSYIYKFYLKYSICIFLTFLFFLFSLSVLFLPCSAQLISLIMLLVLSDFESLDVLQTLS